MNYETTRKTNFRPSEEKPAQEETALLATLLQAIVLLITVVFCQVSRAAPSIEDQLRRSVQVALQQETAQSATLHQWPDYQTDWAIWVPGAASHLPECPVELTVTGRDNQLLPVGRLKRQVRCDSRTVTWHINVTVKASLTLPVVVTQTALSRGQSLDTSVLTLEPRTLVRQEEFFTRISDAIGMEVSRRVRSGDILNPTFVSKPPLVLKGNQVVIMASKNGINASTKGVALEDGGRGEQIEVQNSTSSKVIHAVVSGRNQVQTQF